MSITASLLAADVLLGQALFTILAIPSIYNCFVANETRIHIRDQIRELTTESKTINYVADTVKAPFTSEYTITHDEPQPVNETEIETSTETTEHTSSNMLSSVALTKVIIRTTAYIAKHATIPPLKDWRAMNHASGMADGFNQIWHSMVNEPKEDLVSLPEPVKPHTTPSTSQSWFEQIWMSITILLSGWRTNIWELFSSLRTNLASAATSLYNFLSGYRTSTIDYLPPLRTQITSATTWLFKFLSGCRTDIINYLSLTVTDMTSAVTCIYNFLTGYVSDAIGYLSSLQLHKILGSFDFPYHLPNKDDLAGVLQRIFYAEDHRVPVFLPVIQIALFIWLISSIIMKAIDKVGRRRAKSSAASTAQEPVQDDITAPEDAPEQVPLPEAAPGELTEPQGDTDQTVETEAAPQTPTAQENVQGQVVDIEDAPKSPAALEGAIGASAAPEQADEEAKDAVERENHADGDGSLGGQENAKKPKKKNKHNNRKNRKGKQAAQEENGQSEASGSKATQQPAQEPPAQEGAAGVPEGNVDQNSNGEAEDRTGLRSNLGTMTRPDRKVVELQIENETLHEQLELKVEEVEILKEEVNILKKEKRASEADYEKAVAILKMLTKPGDGAEDKNDIP